MKCDDTKLLLVDFLYDEIEAEAGQQLRLHLESCPACRGAYEDLRRTSLALRAWPDAEPLHALVFVEKPTSWWAAVKQVLFPEQVSLGARLGFGLGVAAITALLLSAALNLEIKYESGRFAYRASLVPRAAAELTPEAKQQMLAELQQQNQEAVAQMVQTGFEKQRGDLDRTLLNLTSEWQRQRRDDLLFVGRGLEEFQQNTNSRLQQTHKILDELLHVSHPVQK